MDTATFMEEPSDRLYEKQKNGDVAEDSCIHPQLKVPPGGLVLGIFTS